MVTLRIELLRLVNKKTKSRFIGVAWNGFSYLSTISYQGPHGMPGFLRGMNFDPETGEDLVGRRIARRYP
jgi:hypothetical protein